MGHLFNTKPTGIPLVLLRPGWVLLASVGFGQETSANAPLSHFKRMPGTLKCHGVVRELKKVGGRQGMGGLKSEMLWLAEVREGYPAMPDPPLSSSVDGALLNALSRTRCSCCSATRCQVLSRVNPKHLMGRCCCSNSMQMLDRCMLV